MNQNKNILHQPSENRLFPAAFLRIRIPGFLLILAMVFITFGCDSIVDQNTEADTDTGITNSEMAGDFSVEEGSVIECIDPTVLEYNIVTDSKTVEWGNPRNPFKKTVEIEYYNTLTEFVLWVSSTEMIADVLVDDESIKDFDGTVEAGDDGVEFRFDLDEDWEAGDKQTFSLKVTGSGPAAEFEVDYALVGACWLEVVSETGRTWMDRNLGASQVATSTTDPLAFGDLFQWGRAADGHQKRNSGTTRVLSTDDKPDHGLFIISPNLPKDWRSPQNDNLWNDVDGTIINNPCPVGYRLPTEAEWGEEIKKWNPKNAAAAFESPLKLTMSGFQSNSDGNIYGLNGQGIYWSSTINGVNAKFLLIRSDLATSSSVLRALGSSVRCIKD